MAGVPGGMTHSRRRQATLRLSGSRSGPRWLGYPLFRPHRLESVSAASRLVRPAGSLTRALVVVESLPGGASTRYVVTYRWQVCSTWRARKHFYSTETCAEISNMVFALRSLSLPLEASSAGKFATRLPAYSPGRHTASHRLVRLKAQPSPCAVLCCPRLVSDFTLPRSQLVCLPACLNTFLPCALRIHRRHCPCGAARDSRLQNRMVVSWPGKGSCWPDWAGSPRPYQAACTLLAV